MSMMRNWSNLNFPWCFKCNKNSVNRLIDGRVKACGWCDTPRVTKEKS